MLLPTQLALLAPAKLCDSTLCLPNCRTTGSEQLAQPTRADAAAASAAPATTASTHQFATQFQHIATLACRQGGGATVATHSSDAAATAGAAQSAATHQEFAQSAQSVRWQPG